MEQAHDLSTPIRTLLQRLERISADSTWAHRASGIRGGLLEAQAALGRGEPVDQDGLEFLIEYGFNLLERAAGEKRARSNLPGNPAPK